MKTLPLMIVLATLLFPCSAAANEKLTPLTVTGAITINTAEAKDLFSRSAKFIDVRSESDWEAGRIPGAYHLDIKQAYSEASLAAVARKDEAIVVYCNGILCPRAPDGSAMAVSWGYSRVYYYREGLPAWQAAGESVE